MSVIVSLALATICFNYHGIDECHPVLLGKGIGTPAGEYTLIQRYTSDPGYGGDVLQFKEDEKQVWAIHRIWLMIPQQHRMERINSKHIADHYISGGCINVEPAVYEKLVDCCSNDRLTVK
jgi:hypothetical protein